MFLLDTNVISELRKSRTRRIDPHVQRWADTQPAESLFISVVNVLELELGVLLTERRDKPSGKVLRRWLEEKVMPAFKGRILDLDQPIARRCAAMHVPDPAPDRDSLIAATAMHHQLTVVTRDTEPFERCGVALLNPWLEENKE